MSVKSGEANLCSVDLMSKGKLQVQPLITHRFPIEKATQAYDVITGKKKEKFLGVLLSYSTDTQKKETKITFPTIVNRKSQIVNLGVLGAGLFANAVLLPAMKKASQAAGRPVRTLDDWGAIVFLDYRFATNYCRSFLPSWISNEMKILPYADKILAKEIQDFFKP